MLKERSSELEIMDDLEINGEVVDQTLKELNTINRFLGGNRISVSAFKKLARKRKSITLADLGCGGGDIMIEMAKWARKNDIDAKFLGIDANPHIIAYAKENCKDYPEIQFLTINIFSEDFAGIEFDILHCCLFMHHFTNEDLIQMFAKFKAQTTLGVIINDLHRHHLAYWSIKIITAFFSKSYMVKNDASVSVARGFKKKELKRILAQAAISDFHLSWKWAFRWKLTF